MLLGVVSDTHGRLPGRVLELFDGVDHIIHAGDVGRPDILWQLEALAPVTAVAGNNDDFLPGYDLPPTATLTLAGVSFFVAHFEQRPPDGRPDVIVSGHTHRPKMEWAADGVLHLNPGSPTRARGEGYTVAIVEAVSGVLRPRIVPL